MAKRVLAVDDNEDLLTLIAAALGDEGYDVVTCRRSRDAYSQAKSTRPDVILLDVLMPVMNGWQCVDRLRADDRLDRLRIVICTSAPADAPSGFRVLAKPVVLGDLVSALTDD